MRTTFLFLLFFCGGLSVFGQNPDSVYTITDVKAQFIGGIDSLFAYLERNSVYPEIAKKIGHEGTVYVNCIVERNGKLTIVDIKQGVSPEIDKEAKRLITSMPAWRPAILDGQIVRSNIRISLEFDLASEKAKRKKARRQKKNRRKL